MSENFERLLKEYKFEIENINDDYKCVICKEILINAHSGPCHCNYCYDCLIKFLHGTEKRCPGNSNACKRVMLKLNKNIHNKNSLNEKISKLIVKCPIENCLFKDEISKIDSHIRVCIFQQIYCPYQNIGCRQIDLLKNEMTNHLLINIVPHSNLLLEFLENIKNDVELLKKEKEESKDKNELLQKEIGDLKDENNLLKKNITSLNDEIEIVKLNRNGNQTDFSDFERTGKKNKEEMIETNKEMKKIKKDIQSIKQEVEKFKSEQTNKKMETIISTLKSKTDQQKLDIDNMKNILEIIDSKQADCTVKTHATFTDTSHLIKKVEELDNIIKNTIIKQINDLQVKINVSREMYFGEFEWKIENYSKLHVGREITSRPFYSFKGGYQMCLGIDVEYDYEKCKYSNIYLHLIRGDFDNNLSWPCRCDVSIDLINQNDNRSFKNETQKYNSRSINSRWNKPINEMNNGILFLAPSPSDIKLLLKHDKLLIKCRTNIAL